MKPTHFALLLGLVGFSIGAYAFARGGAYASEPRETYFASGAVQSRCAYADGQRHGRFERFDAHGTCLAEGMYEAGEREGNWRYTNQAGVLDAERSGFYRDDVRVAPLGEADGTVPLNGARNTVTLEGRDPRSASDA